jgi:hypothetical protein
MMRLITWVKLARFVPQRGQQKRPTWTTTPAFLAISLVEESNDVRV